MTAEQRLVDLKVILPPAPKPGGVYRPILIQGNLAYVSGHGPMQDDYSYIIGKVGTDLNIDEAKLAARQTGLAILASLRAKFGSLNRVKCLLKSFGMVNAHTDFSKHPLVINGYSDLMAEVFGEENGIGARSAVGVGSLPGNMAVEIEAVFEINKV
tara:strand:+ start:36 stop:503 length:468 start_codon:yes stop_codon:yes gene_type:complete